MADAPDSKSGGGNTVRVQVPPPAPKRIIRTCFRQETGSDDFIFPEIFKIGQRLGIRKIRCWFSRGRIRLSKIYKINAGEGGHISGGRRESGSKKKIFPGKLFCRRICIHGNLIIYLLHKKAFLNFTTEAILF